ncbi:hypothetical protein [Massilia sp. YIM B04103]|uniref:hypothetical protein n=1 Tax=Massilia sp. YIM B04103 TaxID=2963106 RepID=UPI00210CA778|nr:hypothetical protein [Massilia sp. YIM B04103]
MADTFSEFINVANLGYSDLLAGVTIASNSANESSVVRDVFISNPSRRSLSLVVGASVIANICESVRLTGSEILAPGNSMQLKTNGVPVFNEFYQVNGNSVVNRISFPTIFSGDILSNGSSPSFSNLLNQNLSISPNFFIFDQAGNFYYAAAGTATLYRRLGGVNGGQTAIPFGGQAFSYDGNRYIYAFLENILHIYDTVNNLAITKAIGVNVAASYSSSSALDGKIYIRANYSNGNSYIIDAATGFVSSAPSTPLGTSAALPVGIGKDGGGNYMVWQADTYGNQGHIYLWNIGKNLNQPIIQQFHLVPFPYSRNFSNSSIVNFVRCPENNSIFFCVNGADIIQFDVTSKSISRYFNLPWNGMGNSATFIPSPNISKAAADFGAVGVRATGVKSN